MEFGIDMFCAYTAFQFVYPHTLESHVLSQLPPALDALNSAHQARLAKLQAYSEAKERARREALNKVAPGWTSGAILEATSASRPLTQPVSKVHDTAAMQVGARQTKVADDLSDFVAGLERLDSTLGA